MARKQFFTSHAKSSAALISLGIHAVLLVVALSFVAVTVIQKDDKVFEAKPVKRPKMQLKKLQVPVNLKKKKIEKPKLRKNIVAKPKTKSLDIQMPEVVGIKGGTGYMDGGGGLGGLGFGLEIDLFGGNKGSGNELEGVFFDLKTDPDGKPTDMKQIVEGMDSKVEKEQNSKYTEVLTSFGSSWSVSRLERRYFKAPKKKFATSFMVPYMPAEEAPKAFAVEDVVKPKRWAAYYSGKIAAPETGRYRFRGIADDAMMVRVKGRMVIDASLGKRYSDWDSSDGNNRKFKDGRHAGLVIGDWFHMTKDKPTDMEVLIGEQPGGIFYCRLYIEQDGVEYPKGNGGQPILPIFKTQEVPEKLIPQMQIDPGVGTVSGPNFGVLK
ncbi:hypothetical protein PDESU_00283 [Pontiella desulfatans]|uniref:PA14 domain-containing protein n=1 Tax=Pontiella desulfatans TaxID=2750659 RepID=A0A6C2TW01_PONDE|nr:hypothetical protein [Pontiella desulfatans]VGO11737.1 hypothetical protein PDESU_00283 [Pontiella desulfatans]